MFLVLARRHQTLAEDPLPRTSISSLVIATLAVSAVLAASGCSAADTAPDDESPGEASSAAHGTTKITFRRRSGAVTAGRETCDESRDPRLQNTTVVDMRHLVPGDVIATASPSASNGPMLSLLIRGTDDVLTTRFFTTQGEDCWAGVREIDWDDGTVWRSVADATPAAKRPPPGSCAGKCRGRGSDRCYCDDRCAEKGDCCGDYKPLCVEDPGGPAGPLDLVFGADGGAPRFPPEDWMGNTVRYDYRRLSDAHPECVERTADGGSVLRIVMRSKLGNEPAVEQVVSGFSTSPRTPLSINRDVVLSRRGVDLNLSFRCGAGRNHNDAFDDDGGRGYSVFITR